MIISTGKSIFHNLVWGWRAQWSSSYSIPFFSFFFSSLFRLFFQLNERARRWCSSDRYSCASNERFRRFLQCMHTQNRNTETHTNKYIWSSTLNNHQSSSGNVRNLKTASKPNGFCSLHRDDMLEFIFSQNGVDLNALPFECWRSIHKEHKKITRQITLQLNEHKDGTVGHLIDALRRPLDWLHCSMATVDSLQFRQDSEHTQSPKIYTHTTQYNVSADILIFTAGPRT